MFARRSNIFCSSFWFCLTLSIFAVKNRCFCQPDGISITLLQADAFCEENFICLSLFANKSHKRYKYQRKGSFFFLLLLMCGDIETCPGPSDARLAELLNEKGMKIFHQNIRGLFQNMAKVSTFLHIHKNIHMFSLSETHIDRSIPTQIFEIPGYSFVNKNRETGISGGVAVYVKDGIPFVRRTDLETDRLECIWLEIKFPKTKSFLVSIWYRPPITSKYLPANFDELLNVMLLTASSENKEMILTGDFNVNYMREKENIELKSIFTSFQLKQIIKTATRVSDRSESLIDLVFTNVPFNITKNYVFALSFSDHDLIGFNRKINRVKTIPKILRYRNYRQYDHNKLKQDLRNTDWTPVYNVNSVTDSLQTFNEILTDHFNRYAPFVTKRANTNICPWLTQELKNEMNYRDVLQRKFRKSKTTANHDTYKCQRNKVNNLIKRAKQTYNKNTLRENINNPTSFWKSLKRIFPSKPKTKHTSSTFRVNEKEISDKQTIANEFGRFFSSIATKLLHVLHPVKDFIWNETIKIPLRTTQRFSFRSVTTSEILRYLKKLQRNKSSGIDELPPNLLKDTAYEISKPLAFIINKSLSTGTIPSLWKTSKVTPLHKSDSKADFNNYRPISVLPCLSKILEKVVNRQISDYLEKNYLLKTSQFGFRPRRSTELACTLLIDDIRKNIDNGFLTGAIFLDLSKAFDTVSHSHLLSKLPSYGIAGIELAWFENYLFNRKQHVLYDGKISNEFSVYRGIPQGSILGPTLFLLHLDDIDNCLRHCKVIKYADDTVIYTTGKNKDTVQNNLNVDVTAIHKWLTDNDLSMNLKKGKTESMIFGTSSRLKKTSPLEIKINETLLNQTTCYKYLGVHLDSSLTMNENFQVKYKKLSSRLRLLSKLRSNLTFQAAKKIYNSIIVPVFTYCGIVNMNLSKTSTKKLNRIHKRAATIITKGKT